MVSPERAAASAGALVFLSGRGREKLDQASRLIEPSRCAGVSPGDATREAEVVTVVETAHAAMQGLDTVIFSAGVLGVTPILDTPLAEFERICDNNLLPVFLGSRHAARHLIAAGSGSLIAIASMYGLVGQRERAAYCASKAAVIGLIKSIALDLAEFGVRANAICPGFMETDLSLRGVAAEADPSATLNARRLMHPIPRAGLAEEVAHMAVYLASQEAAWTTGQAIAVDGGYTAR